MENGNFIARLREIRANLSDAITSAEVFQSKLVGPRPQDGKANVKATADSVENILADVMISSVTLLKMLSHQHEILGDFGPGSECASAPQNRYA